MAEHTFDSDDSDLLCQEVGFDDPVTESAFADEEDHHQRTVEALGFGNGGSDPLIDLPCLSDEKFASMIEVEKNLLPRHDYLGRLRAGDVDLTVRTQALDWISKAHAHYSFGELSFCLAVNYLDRFLSYFELPGGKNWAVQLLAVACFSLGAKMAEVKPPMLMDLQVEDPKFVFEAKTIKRMELLVLSNLKWRMHPCTPYSFIDYFMRKMIGGGGDQQQQQQPPPPLPNFGALMIKAVKLISSTIKGIDFLEFKPSEVAAAVAMLVAAETETPATNAIDVEKFIQIEKDKVLKCHKMLQDLTLMMRSGTPTTIGGVVVSNANPHSPSGVLEAASSLSYQTEERTVGSCPKSSTNNNNKSPDTKKKKVDSFGNNNPP